VIPPAGEGRMPRTITIVQARMGSHRLPGKSMMPVWREMSLLELVLRRITRAELPAMTILATSTDRRDDVLVPVAEACGVTVFRGSEADVLGRYAAALARYPADAVVRAAADNPLLDPERIDDLISFFWKARPPCDYASNLGPATGHPDGVGVEMVSAETLRRLDREATDPSHREHVVTYLHGNPAYRSCLLEARPEFRRPHYRLDIDFPEDMHFIRELVKRLPEAHAPYWTTAEIIAALDREPELLKLRKDRSKL
jgi:spore coat polysaccharide biosynthesis protein SpsF